VQSAPFENVGITRRLLEKMLPYFRKLPTSRREILFELTYHLIRRSGFAILLVDANA